jgi:hypothetical protein
MAVTGMEPSAATELQSATRLQIGQQAVSFLAPVEEIAINSIGYGWKDELEFNEPPHSCCRELELISDSKSRSDV